MPQDNPKYSNCITYYNLFDLIPFATSRNVRNYLHLNAIYLCLFNLCTRIHQGGLNALCASVTVKWLNELGSALHTRSFRNILLKCLGRARQPGR